MFKDELTRQVKARRTFAIISHPDAGKTTMTEKLLLWGKAIVAEGFERIHRTNLVGMGVLPLEFKAGVNRLTLNIDGTETYDVVGKRTPRADLTLVIHRKNGERVEVPVTLRLDTEEEVSIYEAGGVLQRFAKDFLEGAMA